MQAATESHVKEPSSGVMDKLLDGADFFNELTTPLQSTYENQTIEKDEPSSESQLKNRPEKPI